MDEAGVEKAAIVHSSTAYGYDNSYVADAVSADSLSANVRSLSADSAKTPNFGSLLRHSSSATVRLCPETFGGND
jgi:hypothetical protein